MCLEAADMNVRRKSMQLYLSQFLTSKTSGSSISFLNDNPTLMSVQREQTSELKLFICAFIFNYCMSFDRL